MLSDSSVLHLLLWIARDLHRLTIPLVDEPLIIDTKDGRVGCLNEALKVRRHLPCVRVRITYACTGGCPCIYSMYICMRMRCLVSTKQAEVRRSVQSGVVGSHLSRLGLGVAELGDVLADAHHTHDCPLRIDPRCRVEQHLDALAVLLGKSPVTPGEVRQANLLLNPHPVHPAFILGTAWKHGAWA